MKLFIAILLFACATSLCSAQSLAIAERAPKLKILKTLNIGKQEFIYMGFIHSSSQPCASSTPKIVQAISKIENISPLLFTREGSEQCEKWLKELSVNKAQTHFLAHSIFKKYEVEYAPFGIILDHKRRVVWLGNPQILTKAKIEKIINKWSLQK